MDGLEREREREKGKKCIPINWRSLVLSRTVRAGFFTSDVRHVLCGSSRQYAKQNLLCRSCFAQKRILIDFY